MQGTTRFSKKVRAGLLVALAGGAMGVAAPGQASCGPGDSVYLGSVCTTAISFCPVGYVEMAGQLLSVNEYQALFSLIGCQWGGDCRSSFGIPDMRSRSPVGIGQGQGLPNYQLGQYAGVATQTLTYAQLPQHTHTGAISASSVEATLKAFDGNGAAPSPSASNNSLQTVAQNPFAPATEANLYGPGSGNAVALNGLEVDFSGALTIGSAGGSQPFSVQSPVTALRHCMAVDGVYPQRP